MNIIEFILENYNNEMDIEIERDECRNIPNFDEVPFIDELVADFGEIIKGLSLRLYKDDSDKPIYDSELLSKVTSFFEGIDLVEIRNENRTLGEILLQEKWDACEIWKGIYNSMKLYEERNRIRIFVKKLNQENNSL